MMTVMMMCVSYDSRQPDFVRYQLSNLIVSWVMWIWNFWVFLGLWNFLNLVFSTVGIFRFSDFIFCFVNWDCHLTLSSSNQSYLLWRKIWRCGDFLTLCRRFSEKQSCQPLPVETWKQKSEWEPSSETDYFVKTEKCATIWRKKNQDSENLRALWRFSIKIRPRKYMITKNVHGNWFQQKCQRQKLKR